MKIKRTLIPLLITALSAAAILFLVFFLPRGKDINDLDVGEEGIEEIVSSRTSTDRRMETGLIFNGYPLEYDTTGDIYYYSLVENMSSSYSPAAEVESERGDVKIAFAESVITDDNIAAGKALEAVLYDDVNFRRVKIVCTTLPILSIRSDGRVEEEYVGMSASVFDNRKDAVNRLTVCDGKIRTRGNSSSSFDKKGYRIKLIQRSPGESERELEVGLLGMRQDGDWILYAAYNDQERIRNVFSTNLWYESCGKNNVFGVDNGIEYRYVELILNGEYWGLYALGFPLDDKQLQIQPGEYTYQKDTWRKELTINYGDFSELDDNFSIVNGNLNAEDSKIWSPLARCYKLLQKVPCGDLRLLSVCDENNAIDVWLFFDFVQGVDNVYQWATLNLDQTVKGGGSSIRMLYTPWDLDQTFGNGWNAARHNFISEYGISASENRLMKVNPAHLVLMGGDEEFTEKVRARYRELRETYWSEEALSEMIDGYEAKIFGSGAYYRDVERWQDSTMLDDPSVRLDLFRNRVAERLKKLDEFIYGFTAEDLLEEYEVFRGN